MRREAATATVDEQFLDRWSRRSFDSRPVPERVLNDLFEAARWSPSCFNEQPWHFVYGHTDTQLRTLQAVLNEKNQAWANKAPVLAFLFTKRRFEETGEPNRHAPFDAGAAWMALALAARARGLYTHAMAGYHRDRVHEATGVSKNNYEDMAAIAIGYPGDSAQLPENLKSMDSPNGRKPLSEVTRPV